MAVLREEFKSQEELLSELKEEILEKIAPEYEQAKQYAVNLEEQSECDVHALDMYCKRLPSLFTYIYPHLYINFQDIDTGNIV